MTSNSDNDPTIVLPATTEWDDTGIAVTAGDQLAITANGSLYIGAIGVLLADTFTQDSSLNASEFVVNGSVAVAALTNYDQSPTATIVSPNITFSPTLGLGIDGVSGQYKQAGVQSVESFTAPFTVTATGVATSIDASVLQLGISTQDGGAGVSIAGGQEGLPTNTGFVYTSPSGAGTHWTDVGQLSSTVPTLNVPYTYTISVDASGTATVTVSSEGTTIGQGSTFVGTGPFYIVLSSGSGYFTSGNTNQAYWSSIQVTTGSPGVSSYQTPAGDPDTTTAAQAGSGGDFAAPGLVPWSLVGKIGPSGTPFEIGAGTTITAASSGDLYLSVNDNNFSDNSGDWNVSIQDTPPAPTISSVTWSWNTAQFPGQQTVVISGSGFGSSQLYAGDSYYLQIQDITSGWSAGWYHQFDNPSSGDLVGVDVTSWTDSQITISSFTGLLYGAGFTFQPGDQVQISVWNPQANQESLANPATTTVTVPAVPPQGQSSGQAADNQIEPSAAEAQVNSAVCYVYSPYEQSFASGVIIGPHTVLTAAHVLWGSAPGNAPGANTIEVYPGFPGTESGSIISPITGAYTVHYFEVNDQVDNAGTTEPTGEISSYDTQFDYAVIDFANSLTSYGSFAVEANYGGGTATMTGYPADADGMQTNTLVTISPDATYSTFDYGLLSATPSPGNSGGPLWILPSGSTTPTVVGIVSSGADAVELTPADLAQIDQWEADDSSLWASCFAQGTLIRAERGDVPVEVLRPGDLIHVVLDAKTMPVVWIGHRFVDCVHHPKPDLVWPIRIKGGAFGWGRPKRDLWLSPDHAIYMAGVLIPAKHLVNGSSIAQVPVDRATYYHIELSHHNVLLAEGLPTESYLDTGDRANFSNGGNSMRLFPDFSTRSCDIALLWEAMGCAPLVVVGPELEAVRKRVNALASRKRQPTKGRRVPPQGQCSRKIV